MKETNQNQSRFVTIDVNGIQKKYEKMTMEQYQCSGCTGAFYLEGAGQGRKYYKPFSSYINRTGNFEEIYRTTVVFVEL